jgi:hypothetical protein
MHAKQSGDRAFLGREPPPSSPINFDAIQQGWRKMVVSARKVVANLDDTKDG